MMGNSHIKLTMLEACAVSMLDGRLAPRDFKLFTEWLDCYEYVLPADRKLCIVFETINHSCPFDYFKDWLIAEVLYCSLTRTEQNRIISWMQD